ncbi:MAG TPA: CheR family methyltransferase [Pyrinomonadaceae bacterium]|nr:CheR family methyltransferase [Pyrinomonadaceae bacterium]
MADSSDTKNVIKDLVVVGSSAGGVGALSTLVSTLNKSFPAPLVLAQHLDPQRPSHLASILERRSTLPIVIVSEHEPTMLERGKIYVVPANRHVKIVDGHVNLELDRDDRPKPSVDMLLSSAAQAYGEHLIAVILTGSGSDGAAGAVDVKTAGGVVVIQNPRTAPYPSMPLSLPPTAVDHVVEMEQIGPLLFDILKGVTLPPPEKIEDPLRDLLTQVTAQTNIDFRNYKSSTILRRIGRRMSVTHNSNIRDYTDYVRSNPDEIRELVKAFLISVTGFFRDPEAYEFLRMNIIPELIDRGKENGRTIRLWSAGCATGEEAYSLVMLIADHLGPEFPEWNVRVFATDIASEAIAFARRGIYPENVLQDLPDDFRDRFFERVDHGFRVIKSLRQAVIFGQQDISRGVPFPRIDLVTCRNLLIYLRPELQQIVLDLFAYSLHQSNGYLFLGKAETARPTKPTFELVNKKWKIYRCLGGPLTLPLHESSPATASHSIWRESRRIPLTAPVIMGGHNLTQAELEINQLHRINETVLRYTMVAVIIIDRRYRILTINAGARRLLGVREVAYDQDFLHTVRGLPYQEMRNAIDTAFSEHSTQTLSEVELDPTVEGSSRYVNFTIMSMHVENGAPELAVITALDVTDQVQSKRRLEAVQHEQAELVNELTAANKRSGTVNKELQDANEELQAANEELMLTQEELQATNEEFEATNEELQATNEELETNNEELQATNEELETTNDELSARTTELQEMTKQYLIEQLQLHAILERFPHYVMVLNAEDLTVHAINPGYKELLAVDREVIGLPIAEVFAGKDVDQLITLLRTAVLEAQTINSGPTPATIIADGQRVEGKFVHTIVPITDITGSSVIRLFIYSERVE